MLITTNFQPPIPYTTFIDIGPFFDRFDHFVPGTKLAVLAASNSTVQAIVKDVQSRKWVDLARPDVSQAIGILVTLEVPGVTEELRNWIINTPVSPEEQLALRKVYFNDFTFYAQ